MIGGEAPVIVFTFPNVLSIGSIGLPAVIPIYLDEKISGIMADDVKDAVRIESQTIGGLTYQRKVIQSLTLTLRIIKDNIVGTTFTSLAAKVYELVDSKDPTDMSYFITIYYDNSFMLQGYLTDYNKSTIEGTNQYLVKMTFSSVPAKQLAATVLDKVDNVINLLPRG